MQLFYLSRQFGPYQLWFGTSSLTFGIVGTHTGNRSSLFRMMLRDLSRSSFSSSAMAALRLSWSNSIMQSANLFVPI
ncbi:hypothetical protein BUH_7399 [Burkholderia pseudomallei Pakistan 9]|nr:hypothetical protein BUH_7399 [Burkholderia pseudomallei Pakistan 9]